MTIMKFLEFHYRKNENHENLIIPNQQYENHEIHIISCHNNENHENLIIPRQNY